MKVLVALFVLCALPAYAQDPCTAPLATETVIVDPSKSVVAILTDYGSVVGGTPVWTESELKVVPRGAGAAAPPITSIVNPKAQWTLVAGTTDCYRIGTVGQFLYGVPANTNFDLWVRLRQTPAIVSSWSTNSVPFVRSGPPGAPGGVRITRWIDEKLLEPLSRLLSSPSSNSSQRDGR